MAGLGLRSVAGHQGSLPAVVPGSLGRVRLQERPSPGAPSALVVPPWARRQQSWAVERPKRAR